MVYNVLDFSNNAWHEVDLYQIEEANEKEPASQTCVTTRHRVLIDILPEVFWFAFEILTWSFGFEDELQDRC